MRSSPQALEVELEIAVGDVVGISERHDVTALEQHRAVTEALHGGHVVRHEEDGLSLLAHAKERVEALLLEGRIAHGQDLVHQKDVGVHVDHHREGQPHVHARRVVLELEVHELLELGEPHHVLEPLARLARGEAQHDSVEHHVVASGQLGVEADPELDEGRHPAVGVDLALVDPIDAREALEQAALPGPVAAHDPEELAALDLEAHVVERLEEVLASAAERVQRTLLERVPALVGDHEALRHVVDDHGWSCALRRAHGRNGIGAPSRS